MSNPAYIDIGSKEIPSCCDGCKHFDWDLPEYHMAYGYCKRGVFIPVKKQQCKRREQYTTAQESGDA